MMYGSQYSMKVIFFIIIIEVFEESDELESVNICSQLKMFKLNEFDDIQ